MAIDIASREQTRVLRNIYNRLTSISSGVANCENLASSNSSLNSQILGTVRSNSSMDSRILSMLANGTYRAGFRELPAGISLYSSGVFNSFVFSGVGYFPYVATHVCSRKVACHIYNGISLSTSASASNYRIGAYSYDLLLGWTFDTFNIVTAATNFVVGLNLNIFETARISLSSFFVSASGVCDFDYDIYHLHWSMT